MGLFCTFIIHDQSHISTFCTMKKLDIDSKVIYKSLEYLSLKQKEQMYEESFKPLHTTGIKWKRQKRPCSLGILQGCLCLLLTDDVFGRWWWWWIPDLVWCWPHHQAWARHPSSEQWHRTTAQWTNLGVHKDIITSTVFQLQKWFLHQNGVEFCKKYNANDKSDWFAPLPAKIRESFIKGTFF